NVFDEITTVMTIGHSVVVITVIYVYRKVLMNVYSKHDDGILIRRLAAQVNSKDEEISDDKEKYQTDTESDSDQSTDEDWQEDKDVDWDNQTDDKTISSDVEWDESIEMD
ncbi:MAG: hypothetical protein HON16_02345, partial [Euryarchaeota archaeon]|nr:hypothetical protein [Euryarchaeota archaeon]